MAELKLLSFLPSSGQHMRFNGVLSSLEIFKQTSMSLTDSLFKLTAFCDIQSKVLPFGKYVDIACFELLGIKHSEFFFINKDHQCGVRHEVDLVDDAFSAVEPI